MKNADTYQFSVNPQHTNSIANSLFFILLVLLSALFPACQSFHDVSMEKEGTRYGLTEGTFKGRWWHHYERALSFAEGKFWKEAESDLKEAIRQRYDCKKRAKAYSGRFIEYFPHRELGIVYYHQGRLKEAARELRISLATERSPGAEIYLDLAEKVFDPPAADSNITK